jgi:hypothetical protein
MNFRLPILAIIAILSVFLSLPAGQVRSAVSPPDASAYTLDGLLTLVWADGRAPGENTGMDTAAPKLLLNSGPGRSIELRPVEPLPFNRLSGLNGRWVRASGATLPARADGSETPVWRIDRLEPLNGYGFLPKVAAPQVSGSQPWLSVLCKFADVAGEPRPPSYFASMLSGTYPGLDHYWRQLSYNQANINGSASTGHWYTLPNPQSYYVYDMNGDGYKDLDYSRAFAGCTAAADADINYSGFAGVNLIFNNNYLDYALGGSYYATLDGVTKVWRVTWLPMWGYTDITVIAHEMGHGFGLPHSSGMYGKTYDNRWDVMSDTWTDCGNLTDTTFGCLGQGTIAYHRDLEGWIAAGDKINVADGARIQTGLVWLDSTPGSGVHLITVPVQGTNTFYTVEARHKAGYDQKLPGVGVIIHLVDPGRTNPAQVVDADGNGNTGDGGAIWGVGETFSAPAAGISVEVGAAGANGFTVTVSNRYNSVPTATLTPQASPTVTPSLTPSPSPTITPTATSGSISTPTPTPTATWTPIAPTPNAGQGPRVYLPLLWR